MASDSVKQRPNNFDGILELVGNRGKFQAIMFFVTSMSGFFISMQHMMSTFVAATPDHWCAIPYYTGEGNWTLERAKQVSLPYGDKGYDRCVIYKRNYLAIYSQPWSVETMAKLVNESAEQIECHSWTYDQSDFQETIVTKWDLVCNKAALASFIQAFYMVGVCVGSFIFSYISDRYGRRRAALICCFQFFIGSVLTSIPLHFAWVLVCRIMTGMAVAFFGITLVIMTENTDPKLRDVLGMLFSIPYGVGYMVLPALAYGITTWAHLQLITGLMNSIFILYYWFLLESPRWLVVQGKFDEAFSVLKKVSKINGKDSVSDEVLLSSIERAYNENCKLQDSKEKDDHLVTNLFRTSKIRNWMLASCFTWISASFVYYGLSLNVPAMGRGLFLGAFLSALVEIPSYIIGSVVVRYFPRKTASCGSFILGGLTCLFIMAIPKGATGWVTVLALTGKFFITLVYQMLYFYTPEIFPTKYRSLSLGYSSMSSRMGSISAPFLVKLMPDKVTVICGIVSLSAGLLCLLLPETRNRALPESIAETKHISYSSNKPVLSTSNGQ